MTFYFTESLSIRLCFVPVVQQKFEENKNEYLASKTQEKHAISRTYVSLQDLAADSRSRLFPPASEENSQKRSIWNDY